MKIYDLLWRRETNGKVKWEKVGILIDKGDKMSVKFDLIPTSKDWDGWLIVSERKKEEPF